MMKSIRSQLSVLIPMVALPAVAILMYSNHERQLQDLSMAKNEALIMLQGLANGHETIVKVVRRFLANLPYLPAVRNRDAAVCNILSALFARLSCSF